MKADPLVAVPSVWPTRIVKPVPLVWMSASDETVKACVVAASVSTSEAAVLILIVAESSFVIVTVVGAWIVTEASSPPRSESVPPAPSGLIWIVKASSSSTISSPAIATLSPPITPAPEFPFQPA